MKPPILLYRFSHFVYNLGLRRTGRFLAWVNRFLFAVWLPSSVKAGKNLTLGYWGLGTVIHTATVIGDNCTINQNVTIGRNFGDKKVPVIGNNVYIGAGSVVFGEITIGDNAIIGSNSVVNKSVAPNAIVAGNPARVIGDTKGKTYRELDNKV